MYAIGYQECALNPTETTGDRRRRNQEAFISWTSKQGVCAGSGGDGVRKVVEICINFQLQTLEKNWVASTNCRKLYKNWIVMKSVSVSLFYGLENVGSVGKKLLSQRWIWQEPPN